jgi:signal peptidase I
LLTFINFTRFLFEGNGDISQIAATGSMEPTLKGGDRVIESRLAYWWATPKAGDIVIIKHPAFYPEENLVKRIVAVGGETIQIKDGHIIVDGKERKFITGEPLDSKSPYPCTHHYGEAQPYRVPEGCYFLLGDNIYNSSDSRSFGALPEKDIYIKVIKIIYPTNRARAFSDN